MRPWNAGRDAGGLARYDPLRAYMAEVSRHPLLTREQEHELAVRYKETGDVQAAARTLGLQIYVQNASNEQEIDAAFANFVQQRVKALTFASDAVFNSRRDQLIALAARHSLPANYQYREFADAGGLMSYGGQRPMHIIWLASTPAGFSKARRPPICRCSRSRKSS